MPYLLRAALRLQSFRRFSKLGMTPAAAGCPVYCCDDGAMSYDMVCWPDYPSFQPLFRGRFFYFIFIFIFFIFIFLFF